MNDLTPERWRRIGALFGAALEQPADRREAFLAEAGGDDADLVAQVSSLLRADEDASEWLEPTRERPSRPLTPTTGRDAGEEPRLPEGHRLGPYEVRELLGFGGMGQVYRAHDPRLRRDVAVKVLSPSRRSGAESRRLEREARAAAAFAHPNLVTVLDVGHDDGLTYVVSELLQGGTLRERLAAGRLPFAEALACARQIAAGLKAAHEKGVVHRDLKPDNLFLTREGLVKILDFGLAKRVSGFRAGDPSADAFSVSGTEPGAVLGTVGYMAPEQVRGQRADERSDLFAFGVVFFEMVAGRRAFARGSPVETMSAILIEEPPGLHDLPAATREVVRRCLEKERDRRFASARELLAALQSIPEDDAPAAGGPALAPADAGAPPPAPPGPGLYSRDPEAERLYLEGRFHWNRRYHGGLRKSLRAFEETIARDPDHAAAHAGLADAWSVLGYYGLVAPRDAFARARPAAERAVALEDRLPEAHVSLGLVRSWFDWDFEGAYACFARALALRPTHVPALWFLGHVQALRGRGAEAAALTRRAADLEPVSPITLANAGHIHHLAGRSAEALELCRRALDLEADHPVALFTAALASGRLGRHEEACALAAHAVRAGEGAAFFEGVCGFVEGRAGRGAEARARAAQLQARRAHHYVPALSLAQIHAGLGEPDLAYTWIERACDERNPYLANLDVEDWGVLRDHPHFGALRARVGLHLEAGERPRVPPAAELPREGAPPWPRPPRGPAAPDAHELYRRGREHLQRETLPDFIAAVDAFQRARDRDPGYALAYAALADAYQRIGFQFQPDGDWHARAVEMCERAFALDPALPEGHYARARLRWSPNGGWDNAGALRDLTAALAGRPDHDEALDRAGVILYHVGLVDEALRALERVLQLSPGHAQARYHVGFCRYHQGRYKEALQISDAVGREAPASWIHYQTALCQIRLGQFDDARRTVELMERQVPGEAMSHPILGLLALHAGRPAEAREQVLLTAAKRRAFGHYHHALYDLACILAGLGDVVEAVARLREAARSGYPCLSLFERDPLLDPLRDDPGFGDLLAGLRSERETYRRLYAEIAAGQGLEPAPSGVGP